MMIEPKFPELYTNLTQELRRGALALAALSQLQAPAYGYALINRLAERGLEIDQGTLYPLLRRLESQGLLESAWNVEGARPRRYYVISAAGRQVLEALRADWQSLVAVMNTLLETDPGSQGDTEDEQPD
jgi:DNA-binding PadR family transcriptional regulator